MSIVSIPGEPGGENETDDALVYEPAMDNVGNIREEEVTRSQDIGDAADGDAFELQQRFLYDCIATDACMDEHYADVLTSMLIVAAADESVRIKKMVNL